MLRRNVLARFLTGILVVGCLCLSSAPAIARDNTEAFLDGLRQRELYDIALDLLKTLRDDPKTPKAVRDTLDYQFGVTLAGGARSLPLDKREAQLDQARDHLEKFLADHPQHPLADSASRNLADLKIARGEAMLAESRQPGKTPAERQRWKERARAMFEEAQKSLLEIEARLVKKKLIFNKIKEKNPEQLEQLERLVNEMMRERFALAKTYYDLAQTYEPGGREYTTLLREARDKFADYYWKYQRWLFGLSYRLEQARCCQKLGEYDKAGEILDALSSPDRDESAAFRQIRSAATQMALETYLLPQVKKYKEAWELFQEWENYPRRPGSAHEMEAEIDYLGGETALELARAMSDNDPQQVKLRGMYQRRARELLSFSARQPGEYQLKARLKLSDPLLEKGEIKIDPPKNFKDAVDRANLAWGQLAQRDLNPKQAERMRAEGAGLPAVCPGPSARGYQDRRTERHPLSPGFPGLDGGRLLRRGGVGRISRPALHRAAGGAARSKDCFDGLRRTFAGPDTGDGPSV